MTRPTDTWKVSKYFSENLVMGISLSEFNKTVLEKLLDLLWRQWSAIGVSGYGGSEESKVIDPEALLLLTLTVARHDARLFDEVV